MHICFVLTHQVFFVGAVAEQQKRSGHPFEGKSYERHEKLNKVCILFFNTIMFYPVLIDLHDDGA